MLYKIKRNFHYYLKCIDVYFNTKKKYREISCAYIEELKAGIDVPAKRPLFVRAKRPLFIGTSISIFLVFGIILTIAYSDKLFTSTSDFRKNIHTIEKASIPKKDTTSLKTSTDPKKEKGEQIIIDEKPIATVPVVVDSFVSTAIPGDEDSISSEPLLIPSECEYFIIANKADRSFHLLKQHNNEWFNFRLYSMAIGENLGRKNKNGDKKTPEGQYFIIGRKEESELASIYGPLAYILNYPNEEDTKFGRTGSGIWIHGTNPDSFPIQTRGCLELKNGDLLELSELLVSGIGTPICIVNDDTLENPITGIDFKSVFEEREKILTKYEKRRNYFITILKTWENAWESKDIDQYSSLYNPETFFGQGLTWEAWKGRKAKTFEMYKNIEISIDKIFLADFSESTAVLKFLQAYKSDKLQIINGKKLHFVNNNGKWKIYRENTFPKEEHLL